MYVQDGAGVGELVGDGDGGLNGEPVGLLVTGEEDGALEGEAVGGFTGAADGKLVGNEVGGLTGAPVGAKVTGDAVGALVNGGVGAFVGAPTGAVVPEITNCSAVGELEGAEPPEDPVGEDVMTGTPQFSAWV